MHAEAGSLWQVCIWCGSRPVVVVLQHTIQQGLCILRQVRHCFEQQNAYYAEKPNLHEQVSSAMSAQFVNFEIAIDF